MGLGRNLSKCPHGNNKEYDGKQQDMQGGVETSQPDPMVLIMQMRRKIEMLEKKNDEEIQRMKRKNEEEIATLKRKNTRMKQKLNGDPTV